MGRTTEAILVDLPKEFVKYATAYMKKCFSQDYIKKISKNKYEVYCSQCKTTNKLEYGQIKVFKKVKLCPYCFSEKRTWHKAKYPSNLYKYWLQDTIVDNKHVGYVFFLTKKPEDKEPKFSYKQVAYWEKDNKGKERFYARYVNRNLGGICFHWDDKNWRERKSQSYGSLRNSFGFWNINDINIGGEFDGISTKTYKQYLQEETKECLYKSNQLELIKNNIFNHAMLCAIRIFDLKSADEVYKHSNYINKLQSSLFRRSDMPFQLNIHYLNYLDKNNINFGDYVDYLYDLQTLGMKPDKPKDFKFRSETIGMLVDIKKDKRYKSQIANRFKKLKVNIYDKGDIEIKPIESIEEIHYVAKSLHNCMARMYLKDYARGETDLYCLWLNNKPFIAIEVCNGKLEQVRADHNYDPESKYKRIVNKWYKERIVT